MRWKHFVGTAAAMAMSAVMALTVTGTGVIQVQAEEVPSVTGEAAFTTGDVDPAEEDNSVISEDGSYEASGNGTLKAGKMSAADFTIDDVSITEFQTGKKYTLGGFSTYPVVIQVSHEGCGNSWGVNLEMNRQIASGRKCTAVFLDEMSYGGLSENYVNWYPNVIFSQSKSYNTLLWKWVHQYAGENVGSITTPLILVLDKRLHVCAIGIGNCSLELADDWLDKLAPMSTDDEDNNDSGQDADLVDFPLTIQYQQTDARTELAMLNAFRTGDDAWEWNSSNTQKIRHNDLEPVHYDYELEKVAMKRAAEIAVSYGHTRPDGETCFEAFKEAGVTYSSAGENIAAGYMTSEDVFSGWREDNEGYSGQGHRRNMLNEGFNRFAAAHVVYNGTHFWVQEFANRSGSTMATAANNSIVQTSVRLHTGLINGIELYGNPGSSMSLKRGEYKQLPDLSVLVKVYGNFNNTSRINSGITWTSADSSIAQINQNGTVTGISSGTTTLTASGKAYGYTATDSMKVSVGTPATGITLSDQAIELEPNSVYRLTASMVPADADPLAVTWTSGDRSVATVSSTGMVTSVDSGSTYITASVVLNNGRQVRASCLVQVRGVVNGWLTENGKSYWYENRVRQGTSSDPKGVMGDGTVRGREIYDPDSNAWYWLDAVYDGAKACNKEVWMPYLFQSEVPGSTNGKWVRYDPYGRMIKGWLWITGNYSRLYPDQTGNHYYYDDVTGAMYTGWHVINGKNYHFDESSGVCLNY